MALTLADLCAGLTAQITQAAIRPAPFPHLVVPDVFPAAFYAALLAELPAQMFVARGEYGGRKTTMAKRVAPSPVWSLAYTALESGPVMQAWCAKWGVEPGHSRCLLHKDTHGYTIAPHADVPSKKVAYLLYCASGQETTAQQQELGTSLLLPRLDYRRIMAFGERHMPFYGFTEATQIPYCPNTLVSWARVQQSWHSVSTFFAPTDPVQARYSVRGFIFHADAALPWIFQADAAEREL